MKRHHFKRFILAGGVSWLAMTGAAVATYQEAMQAFSEQDYVFALEEFTRLADKEQNADARYQLGRMYELGAGVPKDEIKAMQIYQQAAQEGSGSAMLIIPDKAWKKITKKLFSGIRKLRTKAVIPRNTISD